ncbi:MAG: Uma2 family endonuclease [Saprospiraceae bacterium]
MNGVIEKTAKTMDQTQLFILKNLLLFFSKLELAGTANGVLGQETDAFFLENHRKPDIAYYSDEQIKRAKNGENQVPKFIIEIISKTDNINRVNRKVENYFAAGVKIVWHIFPEQHMVHVYEDSTHIRVCKGTAICSAEAVIPGFAMPAELIFQEL